MATSNRIKDVRNETTEMLQAIEGYQDKPLVSLEAAIVPLFGIMDKERLKSIVWTAKERCKNPPDGLTPDQSASIMLYTSDTPNKEENFYFVLNQTLRQQNRDNLKPWFLYLKLFLTALARLPSVKRTVFRGVQGIITEPYKINSTAVWWGVSSCADNINTLTSPSICGTDGKRTLFIITCLHGRSIRNHSFFPFEDEILLTPGSYFQIKGRYDSSDDLHIVQLEEIHPPHALCLLPKIPLWGEQKPGICLEGICDHQGCPAYGENVIIAMGFRRIDVVWDEQEPTIKCPLCSQFVDISRISVNNCRWRWEGMRQEMQGKQPEKCSEEWADTNEYSRLDFVRKAHIWRQLIIEAKPKI